MNAEQGGRSADVGIQVSAGTIRGDLSLPDQARGLIIFAHGSGSGRFSPRNRLVAAALQAGGFATLLLDLLTPEEELIDQDTAQHRFDIPMLAQRLEAATSWAMESERTAALGLGYFGASTGAAAALIAAAELPDHVRAVVSRGGRPDLAQHVLGRVRAPTLLIVGGADLPVISLNRTAQRLMTTTACELAIVPGATHLFEEPGALKAVARLARDWFTRYVPQTMNGGTHSPPVARIRDA